MGMMVSDDDELLYLKMDERHYRVLVQENAEKGFRACGWDGLVVGWDRHTPFESTMVNHGRCQGGCADHQHQFRRRFAGLHWTVQLCGGQGGIASLTLVQAAELRRYRMTEQVFADTMKKPEAGFDYFASENVAPLVVWLGSEASAEVTGQMFEVEGGKLSIADGWRRGPQLDRQGRWAVGEMGDAVAQLLTQAVPAAKVYGS